MKVKTIKIEKSRTIHVENVRGKDIFNKFVMSEEIELEDTDNEKEVRDQLSKNVDDFFASEIEKIKNNSKIKY